MVERPGRHAPPDVSPEAALASGHVRPAASPYRTPTLTVYGDVRDLTRGGSIGKPDNPTGPSHSMNSPFGSK